jgi:hypothetical protein
VGSPCVGALKVGIAGAPAAAAFPPQAVVNTQTIKVQINKRFIKSKYIGQKLSDDEFMKSGVAKGEAKDLLRKDLTQIYAKLTL